MYHIIEPGIARTNGSAWWIETKPKDDWTEEEIQQYLKMCQEWGEDDPNEHKQECLFDKLIKKEGVNVAHIYCPCPKCNPRCL